MVVMWVLWLGALLVVLADHTNQPAFNPVYFVWNEANIHFCCCAVFFHDSRVLLVESCLTLFLSN